MSRRFDDFVMRAAAEVIEAINAPVTSAELAELAAQKVCRWCPQPVPSSARADALFCSKRCRQTAFRLRRRAGDVARADVPGRFAYADPPYPGLAARYYRSEPTYAGEVDHAALVAELEAGGYAGWALSTSMRALRDILPLCPASAHVCPWVKPGAAKESTEGLQVMWEALIVVRGRQAAPGVRDWLYAQPARGGGELPGRKPLAYCTFIFRALGMRPGDELVDLYPGSGAVGRAWRELRGEASFTPAPAASPEVLGDASPEHRGDASSSPRRRRRQVEMFESMETR